MQLGRTSRLSAFQLVSAALMALALPTFAGGDVPIAHRSARCGDCHGGEAFASPEMPRAGLTAAAITQRCEACHDELRPQGDGARAFHDGSTRACIACHRFHDPSVLRAGDHEFAATIADARLQAHCRACHQPGVRLGRIDGAHRFAAEVVYHDDARDLAGMSPSDACLLCHGTSGHALAMPGDGPEIIAINTHASHPFGIRFTPGQGRGDGKIRREIDPRLSLPEGRIECVTCHAITSGTKDLLVPFDDPYALCLGCHQVGDETRVEGPLALAGDR
jgi:predicted CXXCH cytochrome family protein